MIIQIFNDIQQTSSFSLLSKKFLTHSQLPQNSLAKTLYGRTVYKRATFYLKIKKKKNIVSDYTKRGTEETSKGMVRGRDQSAYGTLGTTEAGRW